MEEYKSNSYKSKAEVDANVPAEKKIAPVAQGKARKKSSLSKAAENFVSEDVRNVKSYILGDVLIPALKKAISDVVTNGIDMLLYGETGRSERRTGATYVSYNKYSDRRDDRDRFRSSTARAGYSHDDIILNSRSEAEEVLSRMDELIDTYGVVSVADMYDLVGISCAYTDNKYGWTNIRNAEPVRVRDGYMLRMPKALPID